MYVGKTKSVIILWLVDCGVAEVPGIYVHICHNHNHTMPMIFPTIQIDISNDQIWMPPGYPRYPYLLALSRIEGFEFHC